MLVAVPLSLKVILKNPERNTKTTKPFRIVSKGVYIYKSKDFDYMKPDLERLVKKRLLILYYIIIDIVHDVFINVKHKRS